MYFEKLNNDNFLLYAAKYYDNPQCKDTEEFEQDLARIVYLKRLFKKFLSSGELKERLILNHIITFYNVFNIECATRILFFKLEPELHSILKTFLVYLNYIGSDKNLPYLEVNLVSIKLNEEIVDKLRKIGYGE